MDNQQQQKESIFRAKSIDRVSSPEQLNDYIRVTTPPVWVALFAIILLLAGVFVWSLCGRLELRNSDGTVETVAPITLVTN